MNLEKTKEQVLWCLEHKEATRDNDLYLVISVWKNFHKKAFVDFLLKSTISLGEVDPPWMRAQATNMNDLPSFESIRRTRQKIQNEEGKFPPSAEVKVARNKEEAKTRDWARE